MTIKSTRVTYGSPPFIAGFECVHYCHDCSQRSQHTELRNEEAESLIDKIIGVETGSRLNELIALMAEIRFGPKGCPYCGGTELSKEEYRPLTQERDLK